MKKQINFKVLVFKMFLTLTIIGFSQVLLSQINHQLSGDAINGFNIVEIVENPTEYWDYDIHAEVYYVFNFAHEKVFVGGEIPGISSGYGYWGTTSGEMKTVSETRQGNLIAGMQRVNISVKLSREQQTTEILRFYLYEPNGTAFISSDFSYQKSWSKPIKTSNKVNLPDLTIIGYSVTPPNPVKAGLEVQIVLVIKNLGDAEATGNIYANLSENSTGYILDGLKTGEVKNIEITFIPTSKATNYRFYATVDPTNIHNDSNLNNNSIGPIVITTY